MRISSRRMREVMGPIFTLEVRNVINTVLLYRFQLNVVQTVALD